MDAVVHSIVDTFGGKVAKELIVFVAILFPGNGCMDGALTAKLLRMKFKDSIFLIFMGVVVEGLIMSLISFGILKQII